MPNRPRFPVFAPLLLVLSCLCSARPAAAQANFPSACRDWAQSHDPGEPPDRCRTQLARQGQAELRIERFAGERRLLQERVECRRETLDRSCRQWSCPGARGRELRRTGGPGCICAEEQSHPRCVEEAKIRVYEHVYRVSARARLRNPFSFEIAVEIGWGEESASARLGPGEVLELPADFIVGPFETEVGEAALGAALGPVDIVMLRNFSLKAREAARQRAEATRQRQVEATRAQAQAELDEAQAVETLREAQRSEHRLTALRGQRKAALVTGFSMLAVGSGIGSAILGVGAAQQHRARTRGLPGEGTVAKISVGATVLSASVVVSTVAFVMAGRKSKALRRLGVAPQVGERTGLMVSGRF